MYLLRIANPRAVTRACNIGLRWNSSSVIAAPLPTATATASSTASTTPATPTTPTTSSETTTESTTRPLPNGTTKKIREKFDILFCGSDEFAATSLKQLIHRKEMVKSLHVISPPDCLKSWGAKRMRKSPVKLVAMEHNIPFSHPPPLRVPKEFPLGPKSILIVCSFGHFIPAEMIDLFQGRAINLHPSLLPDLPGAAPLQWALEKRYTETGVTVQTLDPNKFDHGKILEQKVIPIPETAEFERLLGQFANHSANLMIKTLEDFENKLVNAKPQKIDEKIPMARKIKKEELVVKWNEWTAEEIDGKYRAWGYLHKLTTTMYPFSNAMRPAQVLLYKGVYKIPIKEVQETDPVVYEKLCNRPPGSATLSTPLNHVIVKTVGSDCWIKLERLQVYFKPKKIAKHWWIQFKNRGDEQEVICFR